MKKITTVALLLTVLSVLLAGCIATSPDANGDGVISDEEARVYAENAAGMQSTGSDLTELAMYALIALTGGGGAVAGPAMIRKAAGMLTRKKPSALAPASCTAAATTRFRPISEP